MTKAIGLGGPTILYTWPSDYEAPQKYLLEYAQSTINRYSLDEENVVSCVVTLKDFLLKLALSRSNRSVSVIAHSIGNDALTMALTLLKPELEQHGKRFKELVFVAPDVRNSIFEQRAEVFKGISEGATLYASENDLALTVSKQANGGEPRIGLLSPDIDPFVVDGVDLIDASKAKTSVFDLGHSKLFETQSLLNDVKELLMRIVGNGKRLRPNQRSKFLTKKRNQFGKLYFVLQQ